MAKVCEDWFPMGSYKGQKSPGFYMHNTLKSNLDALIKNVRKDWDFVILISAGGMVRIGKSVLGLQIQIYWAYQLWKLYKIAVPFNIQESIVYNGLDLIEHGNKLGKKYKYAPLDFDEAGADLEGVKVMKKSTQAVKDFLRECGQYNMLSVLVIPEFFDLPKSIAMSRSDFLLDCFVDVNDKDEFERGFFNFYSRPNKKWLYMKGKKELNYSAHQSDFTGDFDNVYPREIFVIDGVPTPVGSCEDFETKYRKAKQVALGSRSEKNSKEVRTEAWLEGAIKYLHEEGLTYHEIAEEINSRVRIKTTYRTIARICSGERGESYEET